MCSPKRHDVELCRCRVNEPLLKSSYIINWRGQLLCHLLQKLSEGLAVCRTHRIFRTTLRSRGAVALAALRTAVLVLSLMRVPVCLQTFCEGCLPLQALILEYL